jgi:protocatechuate 3,4-dioxygenase beta subunit
MTSKIDRRQALAFGTVSLGALLAGCGDDRTNTTTTTGFGDGSSCTLTPEMTEGPYYFDADSIRSDIRDEREGTTLRLAIRVRDSNCKPLPDAVVEIWHCDALGEYSTADAPFLRGAQVTNRDGIVEFTTLYPGWYQGRTVHIHAKVHLDTTTVLTTQLFFDDGVTAAVYGREPYTRHAGREILNADDGIFDETLLLDVVRAGDAYDATISFDVASA